MVKLDSEENSIEAVGKKLGEVFGRYKRGEISFEECERISDEIVDESNAQSLRDLAQIEAEAKEDIG